MKSIIRANGNTNTENKLWKPHIQFNYYNGQPDNPELILDIDDALICITKSPISGELNYRCKKGDKSILVIHRKAIEEYANNFLSAKMPIVVFYKELRTWRVDNSNTVQVLFNETVGDDVSGIVLYNGMLLNIKGKKIGAEQFACHCDVLCDDYDRGEIEKYLPDCIAFLFDTLKIPNFVLNKREFYKDHLWER